MFPGLSTDVGEPQIERLRLARSTLLSTRSCETPKFHQARLVWVQFQTELPQAFPPFVEEPLGIGAVRKSQNTVVCIADHDDFPCGPMLPPALDPKIKKVGRDEP